jgi:hypothetical protein
MSMHGSPAVIGYSLLVAVLWNISWNPAVIMSDVGSGYEKNTRRW